MNDIREFAPAKLNLYLHITGRRADGYHDLDSLVAFATIGDTLTLRPSTSFGFEVTGPQAALLNNEDPANNLVVKAARTLAALTGRTLDVYLSLEKHLPVASGIGGGSSDAAAALRALASYWGLAHDDPRLYEAALLHGQDVPVCLKIENTYMTASGVGIAPKLPKVPVVLLNPNKGLSTPRVYKEYKDGRDAFSKLSRLEAHPSDVEALIEALQARHNDLYAPACRLMPEISDMIAALHQTNQCLLARMSGSGATCFGLFETEPSATQAADQLRKKYPHWWVQAGAINATT